MMILEAKRLGFKIVTLDPQPNCPSSSVSNEHIVADFNSREGFLRLAALSDVITYEFEHISVDLLKMLEDSGSKIFPSVNSLKIIQDKLWQKEALAKLNIPVPKFEAVNSLDEIYSYYSKNQKPFFLKSRRGGYDGKGNFFVKNYSDIALGFAALRGDVSPLMVEETVQFEKEVSVIATRGRSGDCVVYPIAENVHVNSILDTTSVPCGIPNQTKCAAMEIAKQVMECFSGVGTFCIELFVEGENVYVNEVAPRVHNSGHYTIEACRVNQFENHIRAIAGLGLGLPNLVVGAAIMKNVIGGKGQNGKAQFVGIEDAYNKFPNINAHVYGKSDVQEGRKMGHYTVTGATLDECRNVLNEIDIKVKAF
jgi:5-(carboxyamino)imidazole ribonucleotide synthase